MQRKDKESLLVKKILIFVCFIFFSLSIHADNGSIKLTQEQYEIIIEAQLELEQLISEKATPKVKFKRGKAILLTVFTGFLGGHRIYLGTHQRTPVLYSITLGGLGILPLIDMINIIFTKDLEKFEDTPQIIMWGR
ncbi:MAG: TM2 domain-containing protein [Vicingaceae bacterium]|nr:TM2 domain-containing protein [Vicingaceae bacterium]